MKKKYLMIHADDAGMAWSENKATQIGLLEGSISSTSLMVPCPWFYEMAQFCLAHPEVDYGIHLTLTGEWKTYPFKPCSPAGEVPSIVNSKGFFHAKRSPIKEYAKIEEVRQELKNQIDYVLSLGLKPTHLDSHMYTLGIRQDLIDLYIELGKEYNLPILLSEKLVSYTGEEPSNFVLPKKGCFESVYMASFNEFENGGLPLFYDQVLDTLPEGVSILLIHPALESLEMQQITFEHPNFGDEWRVEDANYFSSTHCRNKLDENGIELINWRSPEILKLLDA